MTFRRSTGIFQTAESTGHDFSRLDGRYDEAEAVERAREVFLSERQTDRCGGCVRNLFQSTGGLEATSPIVSAVWNEGVARTTASTSRLSFPRVVTFQRFLSVSRISLAIGLFKRTHPSGSRLAILSTNSCMPPARVTNKLQRAPLPASRLRARRPCSETIERITLRWARSISLKRGMVALRLSLSGSAA